MIGSPNNVNFDETITEEVPVIPTCLEMATGQSTQSPNAQNSEPYVPSLDYRKHAERRLAVSLDPLLGLQLREWEEQMKLELARIESYRGRCTAAKSELYQLMGFFTLFQGVVFTAVATASKLTCQTSLCPILLSLFTSLGTAISAHVKLNTYAIEKFKMFDAEKSNQRIKDKIDSLKQQGTAFKFNSLKETETQESKSAKHKDPRRFYPAVMIFLAVFSLIIWVSCVVVLCWDPNQHRVMPCYSSLCWGEKGNCTTTCR